MRLLGRLKRLLGKGLTCEDANNFLASYLDGALDGKTAARFQAHLKMCPGCSGFLARYEKTIDLCRDNRIDDVPPELVTETLDFLRKQW